MANVLNRILRLLPILIILYGAWQSYDFYGQMEAEKQSEKEKIEAEKKKVVIEKKKIEKAKQFTKDLEHSKLRVKEVAQQIDIAQKQLPNTIDDPTILEMFKEEASLMSIKSTFLTPLQEEERDFYFAKQYEFRGEGTYLQFLIFFERLLKKDRLINVRSLYLSTSEGQNKGRFQLIKMKAVLEAFRYNPAYKSMDEKQQVKAPSVKKPLEKMGAPGK
jgi:Tfp pilus assembly protein PilO